MEMITYWYGKLSFLSYLTIYSFRKYNPDIPVIVYTPKYPTETKSWSTFEQSEDYTGEDWFPKLKEIKDVFIVPVDMTELGYSNSLSEVHKSGIVRIMHLTRFGGYYCDMDILFYKPLPVFEKSICCKAPEGYFSDGFLFAKEGNPVYQKLHGLLQNANTKDYQGYGPSLWNQNVSEEDMQFLENISMSLLYSYDSNHIRDIFEKELPRHPDSIGCHFYGGHPLTRTWENKITPDKYDYDNYVCSIVREILDGR